MAKKNRTVFQALDKAINGNWGNQEPISPHINSYDMSGKGDDVIFKTTDKNEYLTKKLELQQNKYLKDRWVKANVNLSVTAYAGLNNIKLMYRDADLMDAFPEIGAALDTYAEESCLEGSTIIRLLNGENKTIKELYDESRKNFWVYSVDENGNCKPSKIDYVKCNGEKPLYKIILDDGTEIKCTNDHKWMLSSKEWKDTEKLVVGDSLMSIYDKNDYKGYEKIKSSTEEKYSHTHRIVAENVLHDEKLNLAKQNKDYEVIVIHHKSFNKLNNDPNELEYMYWSDHQKLHTDLNQKRWENIEFSNKMKNIFSRTAKSMWEDEDMSKHLREKHSVALKNKYSKMTQEEKKELFARNGSKNGMYGKHRNGSLNPNYNHNIVRNDEINEEDYINFVITSNLKRKDIAKHFNTSIKEIAIINNRICSKYGIKTIESLKYVVLNDKIKQIIFDAKKNKKKLFLKDISREFGQTTFVTRNFLENNKINLKKENSKNSICEELISDVCEFLDSKKTINYTSLIANNYNVSEKKALQIQKEICKLYNLSSIKELKYKYKRGEKLATIKKCLIDNENSSKEEIAKKMNFSQHELLKFSKICGYKSFKELKKSIYNHRVVSVEKLDETSFVFDLINSSCNNCFGIKCNIGQVISHNCISNDDGNVVNVYSKSDRIKSILEDLFSNRLTIQLTAPMIIRAMCKYGNQFMLLDIDHKNGVKGWKQMPVFNVERIENGIQNPYGMGMSIAVNGITKDDADLSTQFIWLDDNNSQVPFREWQIAHFRLLTNSLYLPYGVSALNAARRHWRMLSLMEDMMLIYRLERSVERRVYKIFVGAIDDADVQAYVEQIANQFKRTPIIDPMTGQVDLRKNILSIDNDIFLPVRDENAPTPIDTLSAGQNLTAMDDIKFVQNKVLTALRIPKPFLNFEENTGDGKNLALMDIRFTRLINRIQQAFLMELTKVASIHLYLLGFNDELNNFTLSMNNPSTQAEQLEIENMQRKIDAVRDAVSDPGNGLPVMSQIRALKQIMKWSEKEIKENLEEIRLEKGIAAELEKTTQIIKKTGIFDTVDRIYGEPGAEYADDQQAQGGMGNDGGMGMGGMPGGAPPPMGDAGDMGADLDAAGAPGANDTGDIAGQEGSMPTEDMGNNPNAPMESKTNKKPLIVENFFDKYMDLLKENKSNVNETKINRADVYDSDSLLINEEFDKMINALGKFVEDK